MATDAIFLTEDYVQVEHDAGASGIKPGMLVKTNSADAVVVHATEGGDGECLVVREDSYQGNTVDTAYTSGDPVFCGIPAPGCEFQGLLEAGQVAVIGSDLMSAGNGKWKLVSDADSDVTTTKVLAVAREAKNLSGIGAVDTLIKMRRV